MCRRIWDEDARVSMGESQNELNKKAVAVQKIAPRRFSAVPRPFLRWAGSKQALLPKLIEVIPPEFGTYYEPFLGSGALFFHLQPKAAVLSDASSELINTWTAIRDNIDDVLKYLGPLKPNKDLFYRIRENRSSDDVIRAGEFIYLNKTCWNGLYRVNGSGKFNVPYGAPKTEFIFDEINLKACSAALGGATISLQTGDFAESVEGAGEGDFVYFDPPYVTTHNNNGFRDWNEKLFRWEDQVRLAEKAAKLKARGVKIVVSNANHKDVVSLYPDFEKIEFQRSSTLSSSAKFRGAVGEVLLTANT